MSAKTNTPWLLCSLIVAAACLPACASAPQPPPQQSQGVKAEPSVAPQKGSNPSPPLPASSPSQQAAANETVKPSPPRPGDIREAVARVFAKTATCDIEAQQSFVVGDFNGDGSEDLAVVVKPDDGRLGEINSEVANWTLEDPGNVAIPGSNPRPAASARPVHAEKGSPLLAIIHGVGQKGWQNPEAKQSYLLKNGAGINMVVQTAQRLRNARQKRALPPLQGDAIEETIGGKSGLLFWTGAKYALYLTQAQADAAIR